MHLLHAGTMEDFHLLPHLIQYEITHSAEIWSSESSTQTARTFSIATVRKKPTPEDFKWHMT